MLRTVALAALLLLASPAPAHDWYPQECCSGQDCNALEASRVVPSLDGGYWVDNTVFIPPGKVRDSMDGRYHGCFHKTAESMRCFFAPPRGM